MSQPDRPNQPLSAGDALPPVEPPSAGFILQLFVVPGIIVIIIVMVWLVFNWVARTGNDPEQFVRDLRRNNANRWQAAVNLANALRNKDAQGAALRKDSKLAAELAGILDEEIRHGSTEEEQPITLRVFLAKALGEFAVPDGLPVLLKAADTQRNEKETEVRLAALQSLALLDENLRTAGSDAPLHTPEVAEVLLKASQDPDPRVRSVAAYALGVIGGEAAEQRLETLLADGNPDVRFNAATWLAAHGNTAAVPVLVEMLDPDELAGVNAEQESGARDYKRAVILKNALEATRRLAERSAEADLEPLEQQVRRLLKSSLPNQLRIEAGSVLKQLQSRRPAAMPFPAAAGLR